MIASYPLFFLPGVCVPAPLGSGMCPPNGSDTALPRFFHHPTVTIQSNDGLNIFIQTFPDWRQILRPNASKTVVIVTDDDATQPPQNSAAVFIPAFSNLDPLLNDGMGGPNWKMSGIYAHSACPNGAAVGNVWRDIITQTGGIHGDICGCAPGVCGQNFAPVFNDLATQIVMGSKPIECEYGIPDPPAGETFDPNKVNVEFTGNGMKETIYKVNSPGECDPMLGGWYYDDPGAPTRVLMCPETCTKVQGMGASALDIAFGCQSIEIPK